MAKAGRPRAQTSVTYAMRIQRWDWSYNLRATGEIGRYMEFRWLRIFGEILAPKPFKLTSMELVLMPDPDFHAPRVPKPLYFTGWMEVCDEALKVSQPIPSDILPSILIGLSSKHLRYAYVGGSALKYRRGDVTNFSLESTLDEEGFEYPVNPLQPHKPEPPSPALEAFREILEKRKAKRKETKAKRKPRQKRDSGLSS